jgi:predicted transcriptional regulator
MKRGKPMVYAIRKAKSIIFQKERKTGKPMIYAIRKAKKIIVQKERVERSYKSKLMICIEILCTLVSNGPMKLTQLTHMVELDKTRLIPHLKLMMNRGLIDKQDLGEDKIFYVVTRRGLTVLKVVSPIIREAHKIQMRDFELLSNTLSGAGYP